MGSWIIYYGMTEECASEESVAARIDFRRVDLTNTQTFNNSLGILINELYEILTGEQMHPSTLKVPIVAANHSMSRIRESYQGKTISILFSGLDSLILKAGGDPYIEDCIRRVLINFKQENIFHIIQYNTIPIDLPEGCTQLCYIPNDRHPEIGNRLVRELYQWISKHQEHSGKLIGTLMNGGTVREYTPEAIRNFDASRWNTNQFLTVLEAIGAVKRLPGVMEPILEMNPDGTLFRLIYEGFCEKLGDPIRLLKDCIRFKQWPEVLPANSMKEMEGWLILLLSLKHQIERLQKKPGYREGIRIYSEVQEGYRRLRIRICATRPDHRDEMLWFQVTDPESQRSDSEYMKPRRIRYHRVYRRWKRENHTAPVIINIRKKL